MTDIVNNLPGLPENTFTLCGVSVVDLAHNSELIELIVTLSRLMRDRQGNRLAFRLPPDLVVAFPGGKGTADCVRQARERGIEVMEVTL